MSAGAIVVIDEHGEVEADIDVFELPEASQSTDNNLRWATLPSSTLLTLEEADQFLLWRDAAIIAVVGERNSGKTTLITEMYGRFLRGPFADVCFCHSLSLQGFEKKSFQSRAESGAIRPDTPRTSAQDGLRFFHLALSNESDLRRRDLLISERAGEVYRAVREMPERAAEMIEIRKATMVAFIIDGERVAAPRQRMEVFASVRNIIKALVDSGNIAAQAQIQLVTTKYDLLDDGTMADAQLQLSEFEQRITAMLTGRFDVVTFRTAARDPNAGSEPARGLDQLLRSWVRPIPPVAIENVKMPNLLDEFDRFLLRRTIQ